MGANGRVKTAITDDLRTPVWVQSRLNGGNVMRRKLLRVVPVKDNFRLNVGNSLVGFRLRSAGADWKVGGRRWHYTI